MNARLLICALVLAMLFAAPQLRGDILFSEGFDYADGTKLVDIATWGNHSGTPAELEVNNGTLAVIENGTPSEDANRALGQTFTTGAVYAGFDFSVAAAAVASGTDFEYFAHIGNIGSLDFGSRMDIQAAQGAGDFRVGISPSASVDATWGTDLTFGTTYRAIFGYNRDTGFTKLWIDAAVPGDTFIQTSIVDFNDVNSFMFRQSNSSIDETITVDNLQLATTFNEANRFGPVPEPGSFAVLGMLGLIGLTKRRRK